MPTRQVPVPGLIVRSILAAASWTLYAAALLSLPHHAKGAPAAHFADVSSPVVHTAQAAQTASAATAPGPDHRSPVCVPLWPKGAPGALGSGPEDIPQLCLFPAPRSGGAGAKAGGSAARADGAAAVICPGGAYGILALEKEGFQVAEWLNSLGISAYVLKYRLGPRYRHPAPVTDAKRAMRWVRAHAAGWGLDPLRIGIVGFSAGGHLAATVATRYDGGRAAPDDSVDRYPCQPAFQVLIYPVITMEESFGHRASRRNLLGPSPDAALVSLLSNEKHVTSASPPAFLAHARPDPIVPWRNSEAYAEACRRAGVPVELRIYETGTHAFGLGRSPGPGGIAEPSEWTGQCARWLGFQGILPSARGSSSRPAGRRDVP